MLADISQWSPGIPLEWALVSAGVGLGILAYIATRLWLESRGDDRS